MNAETQNIVFISKIEMIRFLTFVISFIIVITGQMQLSNQMTINESVRRLFFSNITNIFEDPNQLNRFKALKWIDTQVYRGYNLNNLVDNVYPDLIPLTYLHIKQSQARIDAETSVWAIDGSTDTSNIGIYSQYEYPYILNIQPHQEYAKLIEGYNANEQITPDSLKLLDLQYFNKKTKSIEILAAYYSASMQMICQISVNFNILPTGRTIGSISFDSFRLDYYSTFDDVTRFIFEIIFVIVYANYVYMEGYKIYYKITVALKEDEILQATLKVKQEQKEKRMKEAKKKRRSAVLPGQLHSQADDEDEEEKKGAMAQKSNTISAQELMEQTQKKIQEAQRKVMIIVTAVRKHIEDIWSALDVILMITMGIALASWLSANIAVNYKTELFEIVQNINNYENIFDKENTLNEKIQEQTTLLNGYRRLLAIPLLIVLIKLLKYLIYTFTRLTQYLDIIIKVVEYMIFYLVLLISTLMSFALFLYQLYGSSVYDVSSVGKSLVYVLGFMMGRNDQLEALSEYDSLLTFIFCLLFYFIVLIILINMFFVFVKSEYNDYQKVLEEASEKDDSAKHHDQIVQYLHPYWQIYNLIEYFIVRFWFTFLLKPDQFLNYMDEKERITSVYIREFKENPQHIDFNVDFANLINQSVDDNDNTKFLVEEEKERIINRQKMELIRLIWKTVLLAMILTLNFILVQEFYNPTQAFLQSDSLIKKLSIERPKSSGSFMNITSQADMYDWITNGFPEIFDEMLIGKHEIEILAGKSVADYQIDTTKNKSEQIKQFQLKEYSFGNLKQTFTLNTFNLVVNNMLRLTVRRSKIIDNIDENMRKIAPTVRQLFLSDPLDQLGSNLEDTDNFISLNEDSIGSFDIDYTEDEGFDGQGGFMAIVEPKQLSNLIRSMQTSEFLQSMSSLVIQFVTFNPANKRGLAHTKIWFTINQCGMVQGKHIEVDPIKKNSLQTFSEISILLLSISLIIALLYYIIVTIKTMIHKDFSYNRWHNTFILLALNRSQLYIRNRHMPEFIRKWLYLIDVSQFLNFLFLFLMGTEIAFILYFFFQVNTLVQASTLFGEPITDLLKATLFSLGEIESDVKFFQQTADITNIAKQIGILASLAIIVLCLEILYLVSHNKDFQMLTNSIKYALSHLPFILIVMYGFIFAFTFMGHFLLGTQFIEFSTFFGSLVQFTDYIFYIPDMRIYRHDARVLEFLMMIVPYILTVRFIIINMFFSITLRGYLLSRRKADKEALNSKGHSISLNAHEFVMLSIEMFRFQASLIKVGSDQYIMQIIKQFEPIKIYTSIKENIRNQTNITAMKAWAEECAKEIKEEMEMRKPLTVACNEILGSYIELNNKGEFDILSRLNPDQKRKAIEYSLKYTYIDYYRTAQNQVDKFNLFFKIDGERSRMILYSNEKSPDYDKLVLIASLEAQLEENLLSMRFIRQELLAQGLDINFDGTVEQKEKVNELKNLRKKGFNNPLASAVLSIIKKPEEDQEVPQHELSFEKPGTRKASDQQGKQPESKQPESKPPTGLLLKDKLLKPLRKQSEQQEIPEITIFTKKQNK